MSNERRFRPSVGRSRLSVGAGRRPADAASLVLVKTERGRPLVLMGRRHARQAFMPNLYVFPGGRVDPGDARIPVASSLRPEVERCLLRGTASPARTRALAVAAVRETFEETGLVLGQACAIRPRSVPGAWHGFLDCGLAPALGGLDYIFHAITPPGEPRRFNTRFFLARLGEVPVHGTLMSDGELGDLGWVPMSEALGLPIPWVTGEVLKETLSILAAPEREAHAVPFYRQRRGKDVYGPE